MIRFTLRCENDHRFDSWFGSGADFDRLKDSGHVVCAVCGSNAVDKDIMAPAVSMTETAAAPDLSAPASPAEQALSELRTKIEATSDDVGRKFASEARRIHSGEAPSRPIIGEARPAEARSLLEDGIPVAPLPWKRRNTN